MLSESRPSVGVNVRRRCSWVVRSRQPPGLVEVTSPSPAMPPSCLPCSPASPLAPTSVMLASSPQRYSVAPRQNAQGRGKTALSSGDLPSAVGGRHLGMAQHTAATGPGRLLRPLSTSPRSARTSGGPSLMQLGHGAREIVRRPKSVSPLGSQSCQVSSTSRLWNVAGPSHNAAIRDANSLVSGRFEFSIADS